MNIPMQGQAAQAEPAQGEAGTEGEGEDDGEGADPTEGMSARQRKLFELRAKLQQCRKANQSAVIAEKKRLKVRGEIATCSKMHTKHLTTRVMG